MAHLKVSIPGVMMIADVNLKTKYWGHIRNGEKKYEVRLFKKHGTIAPGDILRFISEDGLTCDKMVSSVRVLDGIDKVLKEFDYKELVPDAINFDTAKTKALL